jgi:hypothetical protein
MVTIATTLPGSQRTRCRWTTGGTRTERVTDRKAGSALHRKLFSFDLLPGFRMEDRRHVISTLAAHHAGACGSQDLDP